MKNLLRFFEERRETFLTIGIVLGIAVVFYFLLIQPLDRRALRLQNEIKAVKTQMTLVIPQMSSGRALEDVMLDYHKELSLLDAGLPQQEKISEMLKSLSQRAAELGVTVISVRPQPSRPYPSPAAPFRLEQRVCHALPIHMQVECSYKTLGKYMESLMENFPAVITVEDLDIQREEGKLPNLKISLIIISYLFQSN